MLAVPPRQNEAASSAVDAELWIVPGVIVESPARIGAHVNLRIDNFIEDGSMEGVHARMHGIAAAVGSIGSRTVITADNLDFYETLGDGFYAGGEIRIYRPTSGAASLVRSDRVLTYSATSGALVLSSTTGASVAAGDVFFLHRHEADPATLKAVQHARVQSLGEPQGYWRSDQAALSRDATTSAPENGGASSLKIVLGSGTYAETQSGGVFHFPGNGWYPALEPGQRYTIELWMKQSGIAGQVDVGLTSDYAAVGTAFTVTGAWQKFRYAFTAPAYMSAGSAVSVLSIIFTDPGTLWVDNVALYGSPTGPNGVDAQMATAFAQYRPGATRNFAAWEGGGTSVADWTSVEGLSANQWDVNYGATPAKRAQLPTLLNLAKDSGGTPWLVVSQAFSETEWLQLFEYLGGPAGTPYGDKRIAQRGVATPWTDEFSVIDIEYGNESWNPFFALNFDSSTYGSLAERFFAVAKTSPYYDPQKFRFVANGWVIQTDEDGYGQIARKRAASADVVDVTAYIGGWESASTYTQTTDEDWAGLLTFGPSDHFVLADAHAATRDALRAQGYTYTIGVYEGGPGYSLPCASCETSQAQEQLGKSLAAGVATLDMYLYMTQLGFGPMNYFEFKTGDYWASHAEPEYGFHAYPTWQALALRNQLASGDMVGAHWLRVPTRDLTPVVEPTAPTVDDAPLLGAYAFADADDYTVFVLSRSLTQTMRVELELPFSAAVTITLHALTGNPRAHNRYSNTVQISRTNVAGFGDGYTFDMPPGSIYAFHAESVTPLAAGAGPQAKVILAPGQAASTNERSMRFEALFSEPVDGFDTSDLTNAGTAADVQWSIVEVPGSHRMRFRVNVSQVNGAGTVAPRIAAGRVQDADGNANSASNSDASVDYTPQRAGLLVREPFDGPARSLRGAAGGVGWSGAWQVQDDDDGFLIADTTPLSTATYSTSPGYARAANGWLSAGRALDLDTAGPWADYVDADGALGQSGTTIYAAAAMRRDAAGSSAVVLHRNNVPWWVNESAVPHVQFGYFGSNVWGLRSNDCTPTCSQRTVSSSAAATLGAASFLVVRIDFGATDRVRLYVDPPMSGEPALAAAELLLSGTLQIDAAALFGDGSDLPLAIDELRIGGTYESVVLAATATSAPTHTATPSPTRTPTRTPSATPTCTPTAAAAAAATATPTQTPRNTASATATTTSIATPTPTPTRAQPNAVPTATCTPTPTPTQTTHQVFVPFTVK
jgi:hypothetical protein